MKITSPISARKLTRKTYCGLSRRERKSVATGSIETSRSKCAAFVLTCFMSAITSSTRCSTVTSAASFGVNGSVERGAPLAAAAAAGASTSSSPRNAFMSSVETRFAKCSASLICTGSTRAMFCATRRALNNASCCSWTSDGCPRRWCPNLLSSFSDARAEAMRPCCIAREVSQKMRQMKWYSDGAALATRVMASSRTPSAPRHRGVSSGG